MDDKQREALRSAAEAARKLADLRRRRAQDEALAIAEEEAAQAVAERRRAEIHAVPDEDEEPTV